MEKKGGTSGRCFDHWVVRVPTLHQPAGLPRTTTVPLMPQLETLGITFHSLVQVQSCALSENSETPVTRHVTLPNWFAGRGKIAARRALLGSPSRHYATPRESPNHLSYHLLFLFCPFFNLWEREPLSFSSDINQSWCGKDGDVSARFPCRDSTPSAHLLNITPQRDGFPVVLLVCSHSVPSIPVVAGNQRHSDTTSWAQVSLHSPPKVSNTPSTRGMLCFVRVIQIFVRSW